MTDPLYPTPAAPRLPLGQKLGHVQICDKVPNSSWRAPRLVARRLDAQLKRGEHGDFFTRARGVLASGFCPAFRVSTPRPVRWRLHAQARRPGGGRGVARSAAYFQPVELRAKRLSCCCPSRSISTSSTTTTASTGSTRRARASRLRARGAAAGGLGGQRGIR